MTLPTTTTTATATPTLAQPALSDTAEWWRARPVAAFTIRATIFVAPIVASILTTYLLATIWQRPSGILASVGWCAALVAVGFASMRTVDRLAKRFLPLSTLLRMTLVFPDQKPSRFGIALRTGTTKQLEQRLADVRANGLGATERLAAETLLELVAALSVHDRLTRGHGERVRAYSALIGEELGLDPVEISKVQWAGLIHDIGKLAIPAEILNKPGRLTDDEYEIIKTHPAEGMALVGPLGAWLGDWVLAVGEHHERWDGTGYPNQLAGTEISLGGRIVAVADVFDVITAARSYKKPISPHRARQELAWHAGSQFDPQIVRAFLAVSIGRLRRTSYPLSWAADLPLLGASFTAPVTKLIAPTMLALGSAVTGGSFAAHPEQPPNTTEVVGRPVDRQLPSRVEFDKRAIAAPGAGDGSVATIGTLATPTATATIVPGDTLPTGDATVSVATPPVAATTAIPPATPTISTPPTTTPAIVIPTITTPTTTAPAIVIPTVTTPIITTPAIVIPSITTPLITTPAIVIPSITTPAVTTPAIVIPSITTPVLALPAIGIPSVEVPSVTLPPVQIPSLDVPILVTPPITLPALPVLPVLPPFW